MTLPTDFPKFHVLLRCAWGALSTEQKNEIWGALKNEINGHKEQHKKEGREKEKGASGRTIEGRVWA